MLQVVETIDAFKPLFNQWTLQLKNSLLEERQLYETQSQALNEKIMIVKKDLEKLEHKHLIIKERTHFY